MLDELKGTLLCNNALSPQHHDGFPTKNGCQIDFCMFLFFCGGWPSRGGQPSNYGFVESGGDQLEMVTNSQKQEVTNI